ncbi:MAG: hypothetical protein ACOC46_03620, partial [Pirellulales bacterium]
FTSAATSGLLLATIERTWKPGDRVILTLPMPVRLLTGRATPFPDNHHFNDINRRPIAQVRDVNSPYGCLLRGPLLFALPIPDRDPNTPAGETDIGYALDVDPARLEEQVQVATAALPSTWRWQLSPSPITLSVPARRFDWQPTPLEPLPKAPIEEGEPTTIDLVPYGLTKFRVTMFPVTPSTWDAAATREATNDRVIR